jgi:hypothetical protein
MTKFCNGNEGFFFLTLCLFQARKMKHDETIIYQKIYLDNGRCFGEGVCVPHKDPFPDDCRRGGESRPKQWSVWTEEAGQWSTTRSSDCHEKGGEVNP